MDCDNFMLFYGWPEVPINKNESEIQIFSKYFDIIDKNAVSKQMSIISNSSENGEEKSNSAAKKFRTKGNECYKDCDYTEALMMYNNSIARAPRNSIEFGLAVANRSAILFNIEKYKECLEDINGALRSEYPKDLRYKLFLRQGKCFLKFKENFKAAKSIRKAQDCVNKLNLPILEKSLINDKILDIKNQLKEQLQSNAPAEQPEDDIILIEPSLKDGENPKFLNAAKVVNIKYTKQLGRHVVASTEIKQGDVLFMETPYTFTALDQPEDHINVCTFCLQRAVNCIPCTVCTSYFYCSDICRQSAWNLSHRWECVGSRPDLIKNPQHKLCLSMLYKASHDSFKTTVEDESIYGNAENNHPFVNKLITNKNKNIDCDLQAFVQAAVWLVCYLKNYSDYFDWLYMQPDRPEGTQDELYKFIGGQLVKYFLQINCNAVIIREGSAYCRPNNNIKFVGLGVGIYTSTALLNHSCLPNVVQSFCETTRIVKALKDIKKGTEITISYLDKSCYFTDVGERQSKLERYHFTCSCQACTDPSFDDLRAPWLCRRCSGKAFPLQRELKCSECHLVFNPLEHYQNVILMGELHAQYCMFGDEYMLDNMYKLLKKTCHKHSAKYFQYYDACLKHYGRTGQFKKSVDIAKSFVEVAKNIYGNTAKEYLCIYLTYVYLLAKYCITLKIDNSENYGKVFDETKEEIKQITNVLHYYICPKNIKIYLANITKYLNSVIIDQDVRYNTSSQCGISMLNIVEELCDCKARWRNQH